MWTQSERDTAELRATIDCPPDTAIYRFGDLMALVFCRETAGFMCWNLYVSSRKRMPEAAEVLDAREQLLPNIRDYGLVPSDRFKNTVHLFELPVPREHPPRRLS